MRSVHIWEYGLNGYTMKHLHLGDCHIRLRNSGIDGGQCMSAGCRAFELASLPGTAEAERRRLLHFVVVGGGPTGVEFAGTLSDYVRSDLRRKYPALMRYVRVSLLQSAQGILTQFTSKLANKALEDLRSTGVEIRTGVRVVQVRLSPLS